MRPRPHPIDLPKSPRDTKDLRQRVIDMGLEIRQGGKHEKIMGLNGSVIAIMSVGSRPGNWRAPINAWLQIQRYFRDNPEDAAILRKKWDEKYSTQGVSMPARLEMLDEDYGYRHVDQAKTGVRRTRKIDHVPPTGNPQFRGRRLYTRSTHRVCDRCADEVVVTSPEAQGIPAGRCCRCGEGTSSGRFVRASQKDWGCDHSAEL